MIERVEIRNWQSLRSVDLDFGRFTVIVGASSSGKTAVMRALRAVASNTRRSDTITRGAKSAALTVYTAAHAVTLERTETTSTYRIVDLATGKEEPFPKLYGGVPEAVTAALGIEPVPANGTSVSVAGQFDKPYLLDESGAAVARVLGALTNVTTIFEAVREGIRRRHAAAATLKTREADLARLQEQAKQFATLPTRLATCDAAEATAQRAGTLTEQLTRLRRGIDTLAVAEAVLDRSSVLPTVPADTALLAAQARRDAYRTLVRSWISATNNETAASAAVDQATADETALQAELDELLAAAGTCPVCNQPVNR